MIQIFEKNIKEQNVDFIIIVAYGNLIDDFIINFPKFLTINVHASLLPKWRCCSNTEIYS